MSRTVTDDPDTSSPPARGRRPMSPRRRERQRLEISREAIRLFRARGVAETTGEDIADAVGLSVRTLWRYFRSKESCVEPVLSQTTDAFAETLRRWPADRSLPDHLIADHRASDRPEPADRDATLAVVALSRREPALRAIWLVVYERAEPVLAEVLAERLGRAADDLAVRVQAATLTAALRIATEDIAAAVADGRPRTEEEGRARLSESVRAATHGVLGDDG